MSCRRGIVGVRLLTSTSTYIGQPSPALPSTRSEIPATVSIVLILNRGICIAAGCSDRDVLPTHPRQNALP